MTRRGRRRLLILAAVLVAGVVGVVVLRYVRAQRVEQLASENRTRALELYEAKEWEEALQPLSRAVSNFRTDPQVLLAFAETRRRNPEPRGRHLSESFAYYQRVANVGKVQVGPEGETATDAVAATPDQLEAARIGIVELGPALGRWTELAAAAQDMLEASPPPSEDRRRQLLRSLYQASLEQPEQPILDRYVTGSASALVTARDAAVQLADAVDADIRTAGSQRVLDRAGAGQMRSLILAVALEELTPDSINARLGILNALTLMGAEPADVLPTVRRWEQAWIDREGDAADPRYAALEARLLAQAGRLAPAAVRLATVDASRPVRDRRSLEELVESMDRMATVALQQSGDRVFRAEVAGTGTPGEIARELLARAESLIDITRAAIGADAAWPHEMAVQWRFRSSREDEAATLLAESRAQGWVDRSPVLARWAAVLPLVAGESEAAAEAIVQLRSMGRELTDASARDLTDAWGQALDRYLRYTPGVAPAVLATLNAFGLDADEEAEADRRAALAADAVEPGVDDEDAATRSEVRDERSQAGPVLDAIEGVLRAARAPSLGEPTTADQPVALYLAARHTLESGDAARAVNRFRATRSLWPAWPRAASESINALVQNGQSGLAAEELLRDTAWWQRGGFFPAQQLAEAMVSLGPDGRDLNLNLPGFDRPIGRVELVERAFNVRGTYAAEDASADASGTWTPRGLQLLVQALRLDEEPGAVEDVAEQAMAAPDVPLDSLRTLADAVADRAPDLARSLVQRGLEADPSPAQRVLLQAELAELDGDRAGAAALLAEATGVSGPLAVEFALRAALYRLAEGTDGAAADARRAISALQDPVRLAALLDSSLLWRDTTVARAAIDRLKNLTGPWSTPVRLAEARYALEGPMAEGDNRAEQAAKALRLIDESLRDAPGDPRLMAAKGELLLTEFGPANRELRLEGIRLLDEAFSADPANTRLAVRLLPLLHEQQSWDRAGRVLDRVRSLRSSDPQVAVLLSDFYVQQGRIREAADFLGSFDDPPTSVLLRLSGLLERIGDSASAAAVRQTLTARDDLTTNDLVALAVARVTTAGDRSDETVSAAEAWLAERLSDREPAERALALANLNAAVGRPEPALARAEEALAADPTLGDALAVVISVLVDRDGPEAARPAVDRHLAGVRPSQTLITVLPAVLTTGDLASFPEDVRTRFAPYVAETSLPARFADLRQQLSELRRRQSAAPGESIAIDPRLITEARSIVREVPRVVTGHLLLIEALVAAGEGPDAVESGLRAIEAFPGNVAVAERTAVVAASVGRTADAIFAAREWLARTEGSSTVAMNLLVGLLLEGGQPAAAIETAAPFMVKAWRAAAERPETSSEGAVARQLILRWIAALAQSGDRRVSRAADRAIAEELVPALSVAEAVSRSTDRALVARLIERSRQDVGPGTAPRRRLQQAVLEQAIATRQGSPAVAGDVIALLEPLLEDAALGADARVVMAQAHALRGERSTAIQLYRDALDSAPEAIIIRNNLAFLLAFEGTECEEAIRLAEGALAGVEQPSIRAAILSTLSLSLSCAGRTDEAVRQAEQAVNLMPNAPDLLATLAWVRHRAGDDAGAATVADRARRLISAEPFPAQYADASALLERIAAAEG